MIIGMDFGTTNSGMAVYDGRAVKVLPLDPTNRNPGVARTALHISNDQSIHIGRAAVDRYFEQNIGRPVKMKRVWVGELEVYGADMYYVTDVYAWVDVLSPGRLFLSVKTSLRDETYAGTVVGQFYYSLENLIALYLTVLRVRAGQLLGRELREVVLGRPVRFATDPEHDALAQSRLLRAAFQAGYEKVYLQPEPVAAAFSYETTISGEQNALIFDFGGGTLDVTVMRLGDPRRRRVLATGGLPVAGDVFDKKLVRGKLPQHFGEGSYYGPRRKALRVPRWVFDTFSDWQRILELQSAENRQILAEIAQTAQKRYQIEALTRLASSNYGLRMFDIVERAKRKLSEKRGAEILLEGPGFHVREFLTRTEFERLIRAEIQTIEQHLDETVRASGLAPEQIDAVIRTGGSSQIPVFYEMLCRKFGEEKVRSVDTFSSVTAGLAVMAHGIEAGELDARAFTPDDVALLPDASHASPTVSPVRLELVQRRILLQEAGPASVLPGQAAAPAQAVRWLVFLDMQGHLTAAPLPPGSMDPKSAVNLVELGATAVPVQVLTAEPDEQLLLLTTEYRFLLTTTRQLAELGHIDLSITDLHQLGPDERVCHVSSWRDISQQQKLLLVTSTGFTRAYPLRAFRENIEAPVPLKFDQPLPGVPVAAFGTAKEGTLLIATRSGRVVRYALSSIRLVGLQAVNCGRDDRVAAAMLAEGQEEVLLVTADGYGRRLPAGWIPIPAKANSKGKSLIARRSDLVVMAPALPDAPLWLVTSERFVPAAHGWLPLEDSTKTRRLLKLGHGESVRALLRES